MKVSVQVEKEFGQLSQDRREKVEAIVRRHVAACRKLGFAPDALDRVWIEAIQEVRIEELHPQTVTEDWKDREPERRYDVYTSPVDIRV